MKLKFIVIALLHTTSVAGAEHSHHWGYSGEYGPEKWAGMEQGFSACGLGKEQSPIDIRRASRANLPALDFKYTNSGAEVLNNGHTIQVNLLTGGVLNLDGIPYKLLQLHFHAPSEEKIDGNAQAMVAHLVHQSAEGKLAVVAVLLQEGKVNGALAPVFADLPQSEGSRKVLLRDFNAADLLPDERGYFKFIGSLTTPPCSEGVRWQVLKHPVEVSNAQVAAFRKLYKMNARPVQPLNGRVIEEN